MNKNRLMNEYLYDYVDALNERNKTKTSLELTMALKHHYTLDFVVLLAVSFLCYTTNSWFVLFPYLTFKATLLLTFVMRDFMQKRTLSNLDKELSNLDDDLVNVRYVLKNDPNRTNV